MNVYVGVYIYIYVNLCMKSPINDMRLLYMMKYVSTHATLVLKPRSFAEVAWGAEDAGGDCSHVQSELFDVQQIQGAQQVPPFRHVTSEINRNQTNTQSFQSFVAAISLYPVLRCFNLFCYLYYP